MGDQSAVEVEVLAEPFRTGRRSGELVRPGRRFIPPCNTRSDTGCAPHGETKSWKPVIVEVRHLDLVSVYAIGWRGAGGRR